MSILSSMSYAITGALDTIGDVAKTAQQTVGMMSNYVDHKSQAWELTVYETTLAETAKTLAAIKADLADDVELAAIHAELAKTWKRPARR
jgi:acyl-CoA synthetase (NDP forming)